MVYKRRRRKKLGGSVVVIKSRHWWYRFKRNGIDIRVNTKQPNKRAAEEMESAYRTRLAKGEVGIRDHRAVPTLRQFRKRFLDSVKARSGEKPKTTAFYEDRLNQLLKFASLANARIDQIDEALIERYVGHRGSKLSPSTVNRDLAALRRVLRMAHEWRVIDRVPRIRLLGGERTRDFVLAEEQEAKYLAACRQPLRDVASLILDTGLRLGEALNLEWPDVHLEPGVGKKLGYLQVRDGKTRNARRAVPLTPKASALLKERLKASINHLVFPGGELDSPYIPSSLSHMHAAVRDKMGLSDDFVLHSLRHTALTRLGAAGVDVFTIMRIAGHSTIAVSQRYVHPSSDAVEQAFAKLVTAQGTQRGTKQNERQEESAASS